MSKITEVGGEPITIRLLKKSDLSVMDKVLAEYEDSFSLETFADSIKAHQKCTPKKRFIIARVQTWDKRQPGRPYYSYYNAFHLNKVLFQTQMIKGVKYLHRLLVLNPLTNTDIVGDVEYFIVETKYDQDFLKETEEAKTPRLSSPTRRNKEEIKARMEYLLRKALPPNMELHGEGVNQDHQRRRSSFLKSTALGNVSVDMEPRKRQLSLFTSKGGNAVERKPRSNTVTTGMAKDDKGKLRLDTIDFRQLYTARRNFMQPVPEDMVPDISPPTPKGRRRELSMLNSPNPEKLEIQEEAKGNGEIYDAVFMGTDTTFMEDHLVRDTFENEAIEPDDAKLFEMKEATENHQAEYFDEHFNEQPLIYRIFMTPNQRSMEGMGRWQRRFHNYKCMCLSYLAAIILCVLLGIVLRDQIVNDTSANANQNQSSPK